MRIQRIAPLVCLSLALALSTLAQTATATLSLKSPDKSASVSLDGLKSQPHVTITVHNHHTNADETYSGVPLATLLAQVNAPLGEALRGKAMTTYVIASGSDGYRAVLSLAEIDPAFHAGQVIVADTVDGKPIDKDGPFRLVVTDDKRPARWVRNLVSIEVRRAE